MNKYEKLSLITQYRCLKKKTTEKQKASKIVK